MDGDQVRGVAVRVVALAEEVRAIGLQVRTASGVRWRSVAAKGFRARLEEQAAAVRRAAVAVDDLATALRGHAGAVDDAGPLPGGR